MCEIFGFYGKTAKKINAELREFYSHSSEHPNGWGLAVDDGAFLNCEKEPVCAKRSRYLRERLKTPIETRLALAHIRLATIGNVEWDNCHPFIRKDASGRQWTLIHNGTIFDFPDMNKYLGTQQGETDSERILMYIIDEVDRTGRDADDADKRLQLMDALIKRLAVHNKLNLLIFDGELLYAHTNCKDTLFCSEGEGSVLISTRALSHGDNWEKAPFLRLFAYRDGHKIYEGEPHGGEYTENPDDMAKLYLAYSGL